MSKRILLPAGVAVTLTLFAVFFFLRSADGASLEIGVTQAWARATPPGASVGAVYVTVENRGTKTDRLLGATSPAAQSAMLHWSVEENGVATMRHAAPEIPPGETLEMRPGAVHIMLMGLNAPLKEGETIDVTLDFEVAGQILAAAEVMPIGASGPTE